jgi:hypothetical protein
MTMVRRQRPYSGAGGATFKFDTALADATVTLAAGQEQIAPIDGYVDFVVLTQKTAGAGEATYVCNLVDAVDSVVIATSGACDLDATAGTVLSTFTGNNVKIGAAGNTLRWQLTFTGTTDTEATVFATVTWRQ